MVLISIYADRDRGCIRFDGSTVAPKFLGTIVCTAHSTNADRIVISRTDRQNAAGQNRKIFRKLKINRIQNQAGQKLVGDLGYTQQQVIDYVNAEASILIADDSAYRGVWNATSNSPDITTLDPSARNGDWFWVTTAGTYNGVDYNVNDKIRYASSTNSWDRIEDVSVELTDVLESSLNEYDVYVTSGYSGPHTGSALQPYANIATAIAAASDGDTLLLDGVFNITSVVARPSDKSLKFVGTENCTVGYASYSASNGHVFEQSSTSATARTYQFENIKIVNAGGYGIKIDSAARTLVDRCDFQNNGWSGSGLSTVLAEASGTLGYDSSQADLQTFSSGANVSDGGALSIQFTTQVEVVASDFKCNNRAILIKDSGVGGYGFLTRNVVSQNLKTGIELVPTATHTGCQNIIASMNSLAYNGESGISVAGGINNKFSQNDISGNWNAGFVAWSAGNTTLRDCGLYDNNRSDYNALGSDSDTKSSVEIKELYNMGGTPINRTNSSRFIAEILDTQVHYTGLGSATDKIGLFIDADVGDLIDDPKNIIKIDDVGFIGQDYAIDLSEVDTSNLRLVLGDNSYLSIAEKAVNPPSAGDYYELPFSNHVTSLKEADFSVDNTGSVIIKEGVGGVRLNPYKVNDLQAIASGPDIKVILKDSDKIQFIVPVAGASIDGTSVNSVLSQALVQLNNLFTNTTGYSSGGNPVTAFSLGGNLLTLTLQDGTSFTVDVTTLGVDENKFVSSGALSGTNLVLTMNDASTVTIDATNMINGSQLPTIANNWYIAFGADAGDEITSGGIIAAIKDKQPFYNGDTLQRGQEYIFTHDATGNYMLGVWSGAESATAETSVLSSVNWQYGFRFVRSANRFSGTASVGIDLNTRWTAGDNANVTADGQWDVTGNVTVLALAYDVDNYLRLYDITGGERYIIGQSNASLVGDSVQIYLGGENQPNAKFPVMTKRTIQWSIVHDYDSSEDGVLWNGIEADTVLVSNLSIGPGEKFMLDLNQVIQMVPFFSFSYTGASTGVNNPATQMNEYFKYGSNESIYGLLNWSFNTSATHYNSSTTQWQPANGTPVGMLEIHYKTDNTVELYSQLYGEIVATLDASRDGSDIFLYTTHGGATNKIFPISKQDITGGSQPLTSFAPDISDQTFTITEGQAFNVQIALDAGSDIVNQYGEEDAPSWAVLNQATGVFNGTAPAYTGSSDSYAISCKAANALGGATSFTVTLNVAEQTYTNTKSLKFATGVTSYLGGNAALVTSMERAANGAGSGDAWSLGLWMKGSTDPNGQTVFYFGNNDINNNGHIEVRQTNHNGQKRLRIRYGSNYNYLQLTTPSGSINPSVWQHVLITYDGGTTGSASGSVTTYYGRFKVYIDGALVSTSNTHANNGYSGSIVGQNYRVGRFATGNYGRDIYVNQVCIWDSDQSANISGIYNGGATQDMTSSSTMDGTVDGTYVAPAHYYEIETSVSTIPDINGTAHFVGYNFSSSDLVNDAP